MAVEVAREDAVEAAVSERQLERLPRDEACVRRLLPCDVEHARAGVETDDVAAQMPRQEAGAASDVERPQRRQLCDDALENAELFVPAGAVAVRIQTFAQPPVVVLRRAAIVVRLHGS